MCRKRADRPASSFDMNAARACRDVRPHIVYNMRSFNLEERWMAQRKRRKTARPKHSSAKTRGGRASLRARTVEKRHEDLQRAAFELFDRQIDRLWTSFVSACQQFARGYNTEIGALELIVESHPDSLLLTFSP